MINENNDSFYSSLYILSNDKIRRTLIDNSIKKAIFEGDMVSEIFQYSIPEEIYHLKMKSITLRQGIKKQLNLYRKKYIE